MSEFPQAPLDPQERALAEALDRLPKLEPDPRLDARVLATARANRTTARFKRFAVAFGAVASVALAFGIAWQGAHHDPDWRRDAPLAPQAIEAPAGSTTSDAVEPGGIAGAAKTAPADAAPADAISQDAPRMAPVVAREAMQQATEARPDSPAPVRPPAQDSSSTDQPPRAPAPIAGPISEQAAAPPMPPPAPAPAPTAATRAPVPAPTTGVAMERQSAARRTTAAQHAEHEPEVEARLARIRASLQRGERAEAAASLRAFTREFPDVPIPGDLKDLLHE